MKVLITGCNGLVACRLARLLKSSQVDVYGTSLNGLTNPYINPKNYLKMDLAENHTAEKLLGHFLPDVLVHAAAITKPDVCEVNSEACVKINQESVFPLFKRAEEQSVYSVFISTDFIFSGRAKFHTEMSDDFPPVNLYGKTKLKAEQEIVAHFPKAAIVRTALVYGMEPLLPRSNIFTWAVSELSLGRNIRVVEDQFRTPTFADDLAYGLQQLILSRKVGLFNLAGTDYISVLNMVKQIAEVFGCSQSLIQPVKTAELKEPALRPVSTRLVIHKAQEQLGYNPNSLRNNLIFLKKELNF